MAYIYNAYFKMSGVIGLAFDSPEDLPTGAELKLLVAEHVRSLPHLKSNEDTAALIDDVTVELDHEEGRWRENPKTVAGCLHARQRRRP